MKIKKSIRELRSSTKEIISAVNRGNSITITYRGKDCAKIVPIDDIKKQKEGDDLFGIWKDNKKVKDVKKFIKTIRDGRFK